MFGRTKQETESAQEPIRPEQADLLKKREKLRQGGGEKAVEKQHQSGKLTARERLDLLYDAGTFVETGLFVKHHCTNFGMEKKDNAAEMIAQYDDMMMNPYVAASNGFVDDVILPSETRYRVIEALRTLRGKQAQIPAKKHGNIPL